MTIDEIFTFENLYCAYKSARKAKQQKGEIIRFEINLSVNLNKIINELISKKYKFGAYRGFYIYEPKERYIEALPFKDRVVIKCFCDTVLKPKIEPKLIYDNVACITGKGTSFAIKRLHMFLHKEYFKKNNNNFYFLKCDISKYFPSINHDILLRLLRKVNFSSDEMWFIEKLIKEKSDDSKTGLPLGNQSNQWFALFYLNIVDRFIKEKLKIKWYVRYMDDMILIGRDKEYLQYCKNEISKLCNQRLQLSLNNKTQIGKVANGIDFLGYNHILTSSGRILMKLRSSSRIRMKHHLKSIKKLYNNNIVDNDYVYIRKNAFYNHIKKTIEPGKLKQEVFPKK